MSRLAGPVELHDKIFVTGGIGQMEVIQVSPDGSFRAKREQDHVSLSFTADGYIGSVRRAYWHNPIVIEPPKDLALWIKVMVFINMFVSWLNESVKAKVISYDGVSSESSNDR